MDTFVNKSYSNQYNWEKQKQSKKGKKKKKKRKNETTKKSLKCIFEKKIVVIAWKVLSSTEYQQEKANIKFVFLKNSGLNFKFQSFHFVCLLYSS